ncbi:hypothetical protein ACIQUL_29415 [Streptomyces sp. NPDC090303]|uniref:hypothetical protein n=1 Tax=Streptomyces sp. NPDC090303 TaxID=3365960 RepID=UPI00380E633D
MTEEPLACEPGDERELCDQCGTLLLSSAPRYYSLVNDSSAVDPEHPASDGQRLLTACSLPHLQWLKDHYVKRPYDERELWAHKLSGQLRVRPAGTPLDEARRAAGLTREQLLAATYWSMERHDLRHRRGAAPPER